MSNVIHLKNGRRFSGNGALRTGAFYAVPVTASTWVVRCDWLPDWGHVVDSATEDEVARAVQQIQAENRGSGR